MTGIEIIAELMALSSITAPKSKGENFIQTRILKGAIIQQLAESMAAYGEETGKKHFDRDSKTLAASEAVILIGVHNANTIGLDCQACGYANCAALQRQPKTDGEFKGPICAFRLLDMGIALGSAVKTANIHNVDNRIIYRVGVVARRMGLVNWDYAMGIPLSATGKNIFFDR